MLPSQDEEVELKFDANHLSVDSFNEWANTRGLEPADAAMGPDRYYRNDAGSVLRVRDANGVWLTLKRRYSRDHIDVREEIDLPFRSDVAAAAVDKFLLASGWKQELLLHKTLVRNYLLKAPGVTFDISFYEVVRDDMNDRNRYIEIEAEKGSYTDRAWALRMLSQCSVILARDLDLSIPLKDSLYEQYTGNRYQMATGSL